MVAWQAAAWVAAREAHTAEQTGADKEARSAAWMVATMVASAEAAVAVVAWVAAPEAHTAEQRGAPMVARSAAWMVAALMVAPMVASAEAAVAAAVMAELVPRVVWLGAAAVWEAG